MHFNFTEEQTQLRDTLRRFIRKDYAFERRREILQSADGWSREVWQQFAELGLFALTLPEDHGGLGGNAFDTVVIMEELGRGLVVEPYLATVVLGAGIIARHGSAAQQADVLPAVAAGERLLAFAHFEPGARYETANVATRAQRDSRGWKLSGAKSVVLHGGAADQLIVSARTAGSARDSSGISLFLVDAKASGVTRQAYPTQDGQRAAEVTLKDVHLPLEALIGSEGQALPIIARALDGALAALCAEAVGAMDALIAATLDYLKTRKQFGVPIGSFQALQHRMADMLMHAEQARSMAYLAAARLEADAPERAHVMGAAKALIGQAARYVGQQAVQLHGGIGVTDELIVSHWFKRLTMINATFGDADHHLGLVSDALLQPAAETLAARRTA